MNVPRKIRVTNIDHNGYNGRENPPEDEMIGTVLTVVRIEIECVGEVEDGDDLSFVVIIARDENETEYEVMEHEAEAV